MSPCVWNGVSAIVFLVRYDGGLYSDPVHENYRSLRPVINLRSDVSFSGGNGTQSNPYMVS